MEFSDHYTEQVLDFYCDFDDYHYQILNKVNAEVDVLSESASPQQFLEKMEQIRQEYFCSARRFLMEYIRDLSVVKSDGSYTYIYKTKEYHFSGAGMDGAKMLSIEERNQYITLFTNMAMDHNEKKYSQEAFVQWRKLFRIAMLWNKNPHLLSKEEGMKICHGLQFSLEQTKDFLVRVLENDGFQYSSSDDLIEIFCFLHKPSNNWHTAHDLKEKYKGLTSHMPRLFASEKPVAGTKLLLDSLPVLIGDWEKNMSEKNVGSAFMQWLVQQADKLDVTSRTSYDLYRRMSCLAYKMIVDLEEENGYMFSDSEEIATQVYDVLHEQQGVIDAILASVSIYNIERKLFNFMIHEFDNRRIHNQKEYWKAWRYITVGTDGKLTTHGIGDRMITLLSGTDYVQKADLLILIWLICHIHWTYSENYDRKTIFNDRIQDFLNFAEDGLSAAFLPEFYPPHLLEQTMLMSICHICDSSLDITLEPLEIYQEMCEMFAPRRIRGKSSDNIKQSNESDQDSETEKRSLNDLRHVWETEVKEDIIQGNVDFRGFGGIEKMIADHLLQYAEVKKDYIFQEGGISYAPDPDIIIPFQEENTGKLFCKDSSDYKEIEAYEKRFKYLYAIYLYIQKVARHAGHSLKCGIYYKSECKITITRWE